MNALFTVYMQLSLAFSFEVNSRCGHFNVNDLFIQLDSIDLPVDCLAETFAQVISRFIIHMQVV